MDCNKKKEKIIKLKNKRKEKRGLIRTKVISIYVCSISSLCVYVLLFL